MEYGLELLYQGMAIVLFCIAIGLLIWLFGNLNDLEQEAKKNIYENHVLYSVQV